MKHILIINGPNLNLLGSREQDIYGKESFESYLEKLESEYSDEILFTYFQSNIEGEIINAIHNANATNQDGIILNAGGYTHTSVSIADAVGAITELGVKIVEVHISNILARETFRHISLIAPRCAGSIMGFGLESYRLAVEFLKSK